MSDRAPRDGGRSVAPGGAGSARLRSATTHGVRLYNSRAFRDCHACFSAHGSKFAPDSTERRYLKGMSQLAVGSYKHFDDKDTDGMTEFFESAGMALAGVPRDFYGVNVVGIRQTLAEALVDPDALVGWRIEHEGRQPTAGMDAYDYADRMR